MIEPYRTGYLISYAVNWHELVGTDNPRRKTELERREINHRGPHHVMGHHQFVADNRYDDRVRTVTMRRMDMGKQTDKQAVLAYLKAHRSITPMEALNSIGCYRLGARIYELRHDGHQIATELVQGTNRNGEPMRYAKYTLIKESV